MDYRSKLDAWIDAHTGEMIEDIFRLCRINSEKMPAVEGMPYGKGPAKALAEALSLAEGYGFAVKNYDNYVGTIDLNEKAEQLDILAHLDVVPAGEDWSVTEAFAPVRVGDRLYGRGTADDKGPALAALYAMRAVKECGIPVSRRTRLILGTDEECGSSDIEHYYAVEKEAPMTFSPDAEFPLINIEKGGLAAHFTAEFTACDALPAVRSVTAGVKVNVVPGKARAVFAGLSEETLTQAAGQVTAQTGIRFSWTAEAGEIHITAEGVGAHASLPQDGNNALTGLLTLIRALPFAACPQIDRLHALEQLMPHGDTSGRALGIAMADDLSGDLTLAFSMLTVTKDSLDGMFDSRCPICSNEENVLAVVKKAMEDAGLTLLNKGMKAPHHVSADSDFVKTLLAGYELYTGQKGEALAIGGGTYVHHLERGVAFGCTMPGTDNHMHGADEFAELSELVTSAKIFAWTICELCR